MKPPPLFVTLVALLIRFALKFQAQTVFTTHPLVVKNLQCTQWTAKEENEPLVFTLTQAATFCVRTHDRGDLQQVYCAPVITSTKNSFSSHTVFIPPLLRKAEIKTVKLHHTTDFGRKLEILNQNAKPTDLPHVLIFIIFISFYVFCQKS